MLTGSQDLLVQIGLFVVGLALAWLLLRFFLRLTVRVFSMGCALIFLAGLCLFAYQALG